MYFVDTNVFLRFLTRDDEDKAHRCKALLFAASEEKIRLYTTELVIAEIVWVLQSPKTYALSPREIRDILLPLINIKNLFMPDKAKHTEALDLYVKTEIDYIDAYHAIILKSKKIATVYSYDKHFDLLSGLKRIEP